MDSHRKLSTDRQTDRQMKIKQTEANETRRPAATLMDLNVGRLTAREALMLFGVSTATLGIASIGGLLWWVAVPAVNAVASAIAIFGMGIAILGGIFSVVVARLGLTSWYAYERRLEDWHGIAIAAYEAARGSETTRTIRQWELSADDFRDVLLIALGVHSRVAQGKNTPWSVRELEGAIWLGSRRLGDVASGEAERVARSLADAGLVVDRAPRRAGQWAAGSYNEVIDILVRGWK